MTSIKKLNEFLNLSSKRFIKLRCDHALYVLNFNIQHISDSEQPFTLFLEVWDHD